MWGSLFGISQLFDNLIGCIGVICHEIVVAAVFENKLTALNLLLEDCWPFLSG